MEVNGIEQNELVKYAELDLSPEIMQALEKKRYEQATPVQAGVIPPMMEWKDVIAKAPTGSGKTFAFGIPMIQHLDAQNPVVQGLILAPTRELALQIGDELRTLASFKKGVRIVVVYGGQPIDRQINQLKRRPQIIVATPGRLMDHYKRRTIRLDHVETVVLDEADRMLDMGFVRDVTKILDLVPHRKNLALLSATISREVMDIAWVYQRDAVEVVVRADMENKPDIQQYRLDVSASQKVDAVLAILNSRPSRRVIAFCNTKNMVERLTKLLCMEDCPADCIHGDIRQSNREKVMSRFRKGKLRVLVATDVAARGIDVDDIDLVINYDVPDETEYYIHRIGRTGRAQKSGAAYTIVTNFADGVRLEEIEKRTRNVIRPVTLDKNGVLLSEET
ncbi:MAG: DEAD/DEAH box helicase [Oscillospiraceae bacterium]|nr:DEAD/DEAH box helicase [Oscillospiraceae bacterium]